jgi:thioester reductase-like protein
VVTLVTGGTGFIGRHLLRELARRDGITYVLVRQASVEGLEAHIDSLGGRDRLRPLVGDITEPARCW